jgi:DNA-binding FrmR family transcriptional regulator
MNPRLKTSKKWTDFPPEYLQQIEEVFTQNFKAKLGKAHLVVQGRIYPTEILLRVGLRQPQELKQSNFEVSVAYDAKKKDAVERIHNAVDAAASMMDEHLDNLATDKESQFPIKWEEYDFDGQKVYLQFTTVNTELEAKADEILGESFEEMVAEMAETEDALEEAESSDALNEISEKAVPTMMGGNKKKKKEDMH